MVELRGWFICKNANTEEETFYLHGVVYGHKSPRCNDGTFIHTSLIENIFDKGDTLEFHTMHTIYTLDKEKIAAKTVMSDEKQKDYIFRCFAHFMGETGNAAAQELWDIIQAKRKRSIERAEVLGASPNTAGESVRQNPSEIAEALGNDEFWLAFSSDCEYYFDEAYYKTASGELRRDDKLVHVGMFHDSVILNECNLRYFPFQLNGLQFYQTIYEMFLEETITPNRLLGYIYNSGSLPIRVGFSWGKTIEINPGETVPFDRTELVKYPDSELMSYDDLYPAIQIPNSQLITPKDEDE